MRVFAAVKLPEETRRDINERLLSMIPSAGFRKVIENNLHVTLCFIGEITEKEARRIVKEMAALEANGFVAKISGTGSFGKRVVWAGITEGAEKLCELAAAMRKITRTGKQEFHAHITLARSTGNADAKRLADELGKERFTAEFTVSGISLMKSVLTENGPVYEELSERTFCKSASGL